jgi:hypothetical protein
VPVAVEHTLNGLWVEPVFCGENARAQGLNRVVVGDGDGSLHDDWAGVKFRGDQVHGRARDPDAMVECLSLRVQSRKCRQEGRVNVDDAVGKRRDERGAEQSHKAGKAHKMDGARAQCLGKRAIVSATVRPLPRCHHDRLDAGRGRACQACNVGDIRDDDGDFRSQSLFCNCVDDGLKIGAASRDQHAKPVRLLHA